MKDVAVHTYECNTPSASQERIQKNGLLTFGLSCKLCFTLHSIFNWKTDTSTHIKQKFYEKLETKKIIYEISQMSFVGKNWEFHNLWRILDDSDSSDNSWTIWKCLCKHHLDYIQPLDGQIFIVIELSSQTKQSRIYICDLL